MIKKDHARAIWGYFRYPPEGPSQKVRLGQTEMPVLALAHLRARATKVVKADAAMHAFLLEHLDAFHHREVYDTLTDEKARHDYVWRHINSGRGFGAKENVWKAPGELESDPCFLITTRWCDVYRRQWDLSRFAYQLSLNMDAETKVRREAEKEEIRQRDELVAYYGVIYPKAL